jgi:hypothetical protein
MGVQCSLTLLPPRAPARPTNALQPFFLHACVRAEILSRSSSRWGYDGGDGGETVVEPGAVRGRDGGANRRTGRRISADGDGGAS